jgi:hypothetical protein
MKRLGQLLLLVPVASPVSAQTLSGALQKLRGLESVVEAGITYQDYARRVLSMDHSSRQRFRSAAAR